MPTEPSPERYEFDWEIVGLIDEYGSERAALRATYAQLKTARACAEAVASGEFVPGAFAHGAHLPREAVADA